MHARGRERHDEEGQRRRKRAAADVQLSARPRHRPQPPTRDSHQPRPAQQFTPDPCQHMRVVTATPAEGSAAGSGSQQPKNSGTAGGRCKGAIVRRINARRSGEAGQREEREAQWGGAAAREERVTADARATARPGHKPPRRKSHQPARRNIPHKESAHAEGTMLPPHHRSTRRNHRGWRFSRAGSRWSQRPAAG